MSEIKVDTVAEKTSANGVTIDGLSIKDSKLVTANSVITSNVTDANITYGKIQNVSATNRILGRDSANAGIIEEITPANLRTMLNVADGANVGGGKVLQVKSTTKTDTTSTTTGGDHFVNIPSLNVSITPSATSSKIFIIGSVTYSFNNNQYGTILGFRITRGAGGNGATGGVGTGGNNQATNTLVGQNESSALAVATAPIQFLDSPSTTNATTYHISVKNNLGSTSGALINSTKNGNGLGSSTITVMEIGA